LQVRAKFSEDGVWYDAAIDAEEDGKFWVVYEAYGNSEALSLGAIELKDAPRGCPGNPLDSPHPDDELWCVARGCCCRDAGVVTVCCGVSSLLFAVV
jgi:hypothetical protein